MTRDHPHHHHQKSSLKEVQQSYIMSDLDLFVQQLETVQKTFLNCFSSDGTQKRAGKQLAFSLPLGMSGAKTLSSF